MSRVSLKADLSPSWYLKLIFYFQRKKYGRVFEPLLLWQRTPKVFLGFLFMQKALNRKKSPLNSELRALVMVKVSQINQCEFCIDLNSSLLLKKGQPDTTLDELNQFQQSSAFSKKEKAALAYAEAMTISSSTISEEIFKDLKQHFTENAIVELTALIGYQNLSSKFNGALDAKAFGFCKIQSLHS